MLKMSFYDGTLNVDRALEVFKTTDKPFKYRYGYGWKGAEMRPISREQAIETADKGRCDFMDITEYEDYILINKYSDNDMW